MEDLIKYIEGIYEHSNTNDKTIKLEVSFGELNNILYGLELANLQTELSKQTYKKHHNKLESEGKVLHI